MRAFRPLTEHPLHRIPEHAVFEAKSLPLRAEIPREGIGMTAPKPRSFVSAQMVADKAGVSRSAVSRTFTDGASVSDATRRKVMSAARELGYHVNHLARGLIRDRSNIVCLVVSDITTPLRAQMVNVLTRKLQ